MSVASAIDPRGPAAPAAQPVASPAPSAAPAATTTGTPPPVQAEAPKVAPEVIAELRQAWDRERLGPAMSRAQKAEKLLTSRDEQIATLVGERDAKDEEWEGWIRDAARKAPNAKLSELVSKMEDDRRAADRINRDNERDGALSRAEQNEIALDLVDAEPEFAKYLRDGIKGNTINLTKQNVDQHRNTFTALRGNAPAASAAEPKPTAAATAATPSARPPTTPAGSAGAIPTAPAYDKTQIKSPAQLFDRHYRGGGAAT